MYIFHGDNHVVSRQALLDFIESKRENFSRITTFPASELNLAQLESALGEISLFNDLALTIVEELHSLVKSANQTALIHFLAKFQTNDSVVLWEKKQLSPAQLAIFSQAKQKLFRSSKSLFQWLDVFSPASAVQDRLRLFHQAEIQDSIEYCLMMLIRQIRLLLTIKSGGVVAGKPFVVSKLQSQARYFSLAQLLNLHEKLTIIDTESKTGGTRLTVKSRLDLLQIEL